MLDTDQNAHKESTITSVKARFTMFGLCILLIFISAMMVVYYVSARSVATRSKYQKLASVAEVKKSKLLSYIETKKGRAIDFSSDVFIRSSIMAITQGESQNDAIVKLKEHLIDNKMSLDIHLLANIKGIKRDI